MIRPVKLSEVTLGHILFAALAGSTLTIRCWAAQPYLDDSNKYAPNASGLPSLAQHLFPRTLQHGMSGGATPYEISKYHFVDAHGVAFTQAATVQGYSPSTMMLRIFSGREYQGYTQTDPCFISMGVAFSGTGPSSQGGPMSAGCNIFAGHWLYKAGSFITQAASSSALTIHVADASRFENAQYVVIYDAPAGSFKNAEHALVVSRDIPNKTITLKARGYKSSSYSRSVGSIVAQHVLGQGSDNRLWAFNFSSRSPRDASGRTWGDFYATWLSNNLEKSKSGQFTTASLNGILFDTDFYFELVKKSTDANNDLVTDNGRSDSGENWLGDGLDQFYGWLEQRSPHIYILTGTHDARGYESAHGNQMENWLDYGNGDFKPNPQYKQLNSMFAMYLYNAGARTRGEPLVHNLTKTPTKLYPGAALPIPPDNRPFRLGLALTLMEDGYFGTHYLVAPDAWWDEYAVDVAANSPTFGRAIHKSDIPRVHQNRGWLGRPLGKFKRIYSDATFAASRSLLANGTFEFNANNWLPTNVSVSRTTASAMDGTGALWVSTMNTYRMNDYEAKVRSEALNLVAGKGYTLAFSARADKHREIKVSIGTESNVRIPVGPRWRRYVLGFQQQKTQSSRVSFQVGREDTQLWFDSVYVFEGNANVFRRDFERGIAIANATPETRTIALGSAFRRITGTQDPHTNNGQTVTSVTLAPYDGLLLVRPPR